MTELSPPCPRCGSISAPKHTSKLNVSESLCVDRKKCNERRYPTHNVRLGFCAMCDMPVPSGVPDSPLCGINTHSGVVHRACFERIRDKPLWPRIIVNTGGWYREIPEGTAFLTPGDSNFTARDADGNKLEGKPFIKLVEAPWWTLIPKETE